MHVHSALVHELLLPPHRLQDLVAGAHMARMPHQAGQQVELTRCQVCHAPTHHRPVAAAVHHDTATVQEERFLVQPVAATPHDGPHAGHQLAHAEGLDDIVVGAHLQSRHPVRLHGCATPPLSSS